MMAGAAVAVAAASVIAAQVAAKQAEAAGAAQADLYGQEAEDVSRASTAAKAEIERKYSGYLTERSVANALGGIDSFSGSTLAGERRSMAEVERDRLYTDANTAAQRRRLLFQGKVAKVGAANEATGARISGWAQGISSGVSTYAAAGGFGGGG